MIINPFAFGGPPPFTPTDISGLEAWYDASDTATITDAGSGAVSAWADKTGNHNLAQASSGSRPVTGTRTINGLNVVDFYGGRYVSTSPFWFTLTGSTCFVVFHADAPAGQATLSGIVYEHQAGAYNREYGIRVYGTATRTLEFVHVDSASSLRFFEKTNVDVYGTTRLATVTDSLTTASLYLAGSLVDSDAYTRSGVVAPGIFALGSHQYGGGARFLDGTIAEVIVYSSVLGSTDRAAVEAYLTAKWGL